MNSASINANSINGYSIKGNSIKGNIVPLQFFRVVPLHSPLMLLALAGVGVLGMVTLVLDPSMAGKALVPVLLVQMFAASSGFAVPARRGHFDLLLTGGSARLKVAVTHLAVSVAPGLAVWAALVVVESVAGRTLSPRTGSSGSVFAVMVVSVLSWALTVPLPRLSGGIVWLLASFVAINGFVDWRALIGGGPQGGGDALTLAIAYLLCPFLLVGAPINASRVLVVAPAATAALVMSLLAIVWITRMTVPLEAAQ